MLWSITLCGIVLVPFDAAPSPFSVAKVIGGSVPAITVTGIGAEKGPGPTRVTAWT